MWSWSLRQKVDRGLLSFRDANVFPTVGRVRSIFGRIARQISNGIRDGVRPPESDDDPLRIWRVRKSDIAAGVREKRSGIPCLRTSLEVVRRQGKSAVAYRDQLEPLEIMASAETTEGFLYAGRTNAVRYVD
jgi:hypothetical protein